MPDPLRLTIGILIPLIAFAFMYWRYQKQRQGLHLELASLQLHLLKQLDQGEKTTTQLQDALQAEEIIILIGLNQLEHHGNVAFTEHPDGKTYHLTLAGKERFRALKEAINNEGDTP